MYCFSYMLLIVIILFPFIQVINYDMPLSAAGYVHRIGRTGRGYSTGASVSLVSFLRKCKSYCIWDKDPHAFCPSVHLYIYKLVYIVRLPTTCPSFWFIMVTFYLSILKEVEPGMRSTSIIYSAFLCIWLITIVDLLGSLDLVWMH